MENMLYYYNWGGELSLISCKNGILYQRRGNALMAFDIRNKS